MVVNAVTETEAQLSTLLDRVSRGEGVIISRAGKPVAAPVPYAHGQGPRRPGRLRGKIRIAADFDELPADMAEASGANSP